MDNLVMLVPSRGRPDNIRGLLKTCQETNAELTTRFVIGVDEDDDTLSAYRDVVADSPVTAEVFSLPVDPNAKRGMVYPLNLMAIEYAGRAPAVGFMGDDCLPRTDGWDRLLLDTLTRPVSMAYGNDLLQGANIPTAIIMASAIPQALGFMAPPRLAHLCVDCVWMDWGRALRSITYLPDVVLEHMHPVNGKANWDALYAAVNAPAATGDDLAAYQYYKATQFTLDVNTLRTVEA